MKKTIYNDLETNLKNTRKEDEITMRLNLKKQVEKEQELRQEINKNKFKDNELFFKKILIKTLIRLGFIFNIDYTNENEKAITFSFRGMENYYLYNSDMLDLTVPKTTGFFIIKDVETVLKENKVPFTYRFYDELENEDEFLLASGGISDVMNEEFIDGYEEFIKEYNKK